MYHKLIETLKKTGEDVSKSIEVKCAALDNAEKLKKYLDKCSETSAIATLLDCRLKISYFESLGWDERNGENLVDSFIKPEYDFRT